MTEFGNLALIDQDAAEEAGVAIPLPGVKKGERRVPPSAGQAAVGVARHRFSRQQWFYSSWGNSH